MLSKLILSNYIKYSTRQKYWITTFGSVLSYGKVPLLIFVVKNRVLGVKQRSCGLIRKEIENNLNDIFTKKSVIRGFYATTQQIRA